MIFNIEIDSRRYLVAYANIFEFELTEQNKTLLIQQYNGICYGRNLFWSNILRKILQNPVSVWLATFIISQCAISMALMLADAGSLKPEIKLAQALHDYETILSAEDRSQLYSQGSPDGRAAINLTTLIDEKCSDGRRRCMGPRLITFLESIQQFSQIVDTFVSSHPQVAALVWGGVRLALLVVLLPISSIRFNFDRLRTMFRPTLISCQLSSWI